MAKVVIRFGIYTTEDKNIDLLIELLPMKPHLIRRKGQPFILNNGKETGRMIKENSIDFKQNIDSIYYIEDAYKIWEEQWKEHYEKLKQFKNDGYKLQLHIDIIVENMNFPAMVLSNESLKFLGVYGIDLAFDFYFDDID